MLKDIVIFTSNSESSEFANPPTEHDFKNELLDFALPQFCVPASSQKIRAKEAFLKYHFSHIPFWIFVVPPVTAFLVVFFFSSIKTISPECSPCLNPTVKDQIHVHPPLNTQGNPNVGSLPQVSEANEKRGIDDTPTLLTRENNELPPSENKNALFTIFNSPGALKKLEMVNVDQSSDFSFKCHSDTHKGLYIHKHNPLLPFSPAACHNFGVSSQIQLDCVYKGESYCSFLPKPTEIMLSFLSSSFSASDTFKTLTVDFVGKRERTRMFLACVESIDVKKGAAQLLPNRKIQNFALKCWDYNRSLLICYNSGAPCPKCSATGSREKCVQGIYYYGENSKSESASAFYALEAESKSTPELVNNENNGAAFEPKIRTDTVGDNISPSTDKKQFQMLYMLPVGVAMPIQAKMESAAGEIQLVDKKNNLIHDIQLYKALTKSRDCSDNMAPQFSSVLKDDCKSLDGQVVLTSVILESGTKDLFYELPAGSAAWRIVNAPVCTQVIIERAKLKCLTHDANSIVLICTRDRKACPVCTGTNPVDCMVNGLYISSQAPTQSFFLNDYKTNTILNEHFLRREFENEILRPANENDEAEPKKSSDYTSDFKAAPSFRFARGPSDARALISNKRSFTIENLKPIPKKVKNFVYSLCANRKAMQIQRGSALYSISSALKSFGATYTAEQQENVKNHWYSDINQVCQRGEIYLSEIILVSAWQYEKGILGHSY